MELLRRYWWMLLLRGIVAILFGLLVLTRPGLSLVALTLAFGAFAFLQAATLVRMRFPAHHPCAALTLVRSRLWICEPLRSVGACGEK